MTITTGVDFAAEADKYTSTTVPNDPNTADNLGLDEQGQTELTDEEKSAQKSDDGQINIDNSLDLSDNDDDDSDDDSFDVVATAPNAEEQKKFEEGIHEYALTQVKTAMKSGDLQRALADGKPETFIAALENILTEMHIQAIRSNMVLAKHYADGAVQSFNASAKERAKAAKADAALAKQLEQYPNAQSPKYRRIVREKYGQALTKLKPNEAAKAVVQYLKKNFPDALVQPQTTQTDGKSINDDWWNGMRGMQP